MSHKKNSWNGLDKAKKDEIFPTSYWFFGTFFLKIALCGELIHI